MGGGYSGKFAGTAGAIGANKEYQSSLFDDVPVRSKGNVISIGGAGGGTLKEKMKKCVCCKEGTIPVGIDGAICPVCGWIDDEVQNKYPESMNGKNSMCLKDAKVAFKSRVT